MLRWSSMQASSLIFAILAAVLAWLLWTRRVGKPGMWPSMVVLLVGTASAALYVTPLLGWWRRLARRISSAEPQWLGGYSADALIGVALVAALFVLVANLVIARQVDRATLCAAAAIPVTAATVPGPIGAGVYAATAWLTGGAGWLLGAVMGWF